MSQQILPVIPLDGTIRSCSSECFSKEESSPVTLPSPSIRWLTGSQQQQNNISSGTSSTSLNLSGTIDSCCEKNSTKQQTAVGSLPINETSGMSIFMVTSPSPSRSPSSSPSHSDDLSFEQKDSLLNELTDKVNLSSLSFLQTKQRKIDHRRNKSEPVIAASLEDTSSINSYPGTKILESSSTSTTSNESAITSNEPFEKKRKSSKKQIVSSINVKKLAESRIHSQTQQKISSSSSSTTKKKKSWFYVSFIL